MEKAKIGEIFNLGSGCEMNNIDLVRRILSLLKKPESLIQFVEDRPGHDFRYSLNSDKIRAETGWKPKINIDKGLEKTVRWYLKN